MHQRVPKKASESKKQKLEKQDPGIVPQDGEDGNGKSEILPGPRIPVKPPVVFMDMVKKELYERHDWAYGTGGGGTPRNATMAPYDPKSDHRNDLSGAANDIDKLQKLTTVVRDGKPFDDKRTKQGLRWLSQIAKAYLESKGLVPEEVQTALTSDGTLFIATNKDKTNGVLADLAKKFDTAGAVVEHLREEVLKDLDGLDRVSQRRGQFEKADQRLLNPGEAIVPKGYKELVKGLEQPLRVVKELPSIDDLHAERRLDLELPDLDTDRLGGTMRPCFICHTAVYLPKGSGESQHSGPFWVAANTNIDIGRVCKLDNVDKFEELLAGDKSGRALKTALQPFAENIAEKLDGIARQTGLYYSLMPHENGKNQLSKDADTASESEVEAPRIMRSLPSPLSEKYKLVAPNEIHVGTFTAADVNGMYVELETAQQKKHYFSATDLEATARKDPTSAKELSSAFELLERQNFTGVKRRSPEVPPVASDAPRDEKHDRPLWRVGRDATGKAICQQFLAESEFNKNQPANLDDKKVDAKKNVKPAFKKTVIKTMDL